MGRWQRKRSRQRPSSAQTPGKAEATAGDSTPKAHDDSIACGPGIAAVRELKHKAIVKEMEENMRAASLRNDSLCQENAALKARIAQLEAKLAARNDRETSLEGRIRELEEGEKEEEEEEDEKEKQEQKKKE